MARRRFARVYAREPSLGLARYLSCPWLLVDNPQWSVLVMCVDDFFFFCFARLERETF